MRPDFIRNVPIRLADLEFANNQTVVHQPAPESATNKAPPVAPQKDIHDGHNHR
jgi:hypothetical protein